MKNKSQGAHNADSREDKIKKTPASSTNNFVPFLQAWFFFYATSLHKLIAIK